MNPKLTIFALSLLCLSNIASFAEGRTVLELDAETGEFRFPKGTTKINRAEGADITYEIGCRMVDGMDAAGIKDPIKEGLRLLTMSESLGSTKASLKLATLKAEGKVVALDRRDALKLALEAYLKDIELRKDDASDFEKDKGRADAGKREPLFWQGIGWYIDGSSVHHMWQEAPKMIIRSAKYGYSNAQLACGVMYLRGDAVPKNWIEAYKWLLIAQANVFPPTSNNYCFDQRRFTSLLIDLVELQLTKEQVAEGQKAALEFTAQTESAGQSDPGK